MFVTSAGVDVIKPRYWLITLGGLGAYGKDISVSGRQRAAMDTGSTLIGGPNDVVAAFYAAIPGSAPRTDASGYYSYPCDAPVNATMTFGNQKYSISADQLSVYGVGGGQCVGSIFGIGTGANDEAQWIVGTQFLSSVYRYVAFPQPGLPETDAVHSIFSVNNNKPQVGFASLYSNATNGPTVSQQVTAAPNVNAASPSVTRAGVLLAFTFLSASALCLLAL